MGTARPYFFLRTKVARCSVTSVATVSAPIAITMVVVHDLCSYVRKSFVGARASGREHRSKDVVAGIVAVEGLIPGGSGVGSPRRWDGYVRSALLYDWGRSSVNVGTG